MAKSFRGVCKSVSSQSCGLLSRSQRLPSPYLPLDACLFKKTRSVQFEILRFSEFPSVSSTRTDTLLNSILLLGPLGLMLLRTLMEDKQLDFNQPLLSVRRFSPTVALEKDNKKKTDNSLPSVPPLPYYKSELKSGPVRNAGTVPFIWEQSPGRPKNESKHQTKGLERPPIAPKLPPGRSKKVEQAHANISENSIVTGSEAGKVDSSSLSLPSIEENTMKIESSKNAVEEKESSDSGDSEEAYLDALDTLSRTESYFLNCSLSGLSGLDEQVAKPSGAFSADPVTRDFMMDRFLPAAKAMAYETPQHTSRKQPTVQEQPREVKKLIGGHTRPPLLRPRPNILPNYPEDNTEEQSDDSEDDYNEPGNLSTTVCGLLPKFCLLNPVPAMSVRTRVSRHPVDKAQARSTSDVSSQKTKKHIGSSHEQRSLGGTQKVDLEGKYAPRKKSDQVPNQSNFQKFQATSLYSRLQGSGITLQQNELPQSSFCEENRFSGIPQVKEGEKRSSNDSHELLADRGTIRDFTATPAIEKTLYVDSVHKLFSPKSSLSSSDRKGSSNSVNSHFEIIAEVSGSEEIPSVNSSCRDFENSNVMDKDVVLQLKSLDPVDSVLLSLTGKSDEEGMNEDICQDSITSANLKLSSSGHTDIEDQQHLTKVENVDDSPELNSQFPLPPPLPKSPSESWLWRTLPSMSSRKSSSHSYLGTRIKSPHLASKMPRSILKTKFQHQP